ncbi:VWA domain-containing protein [Candidatus Parcubacteria bacterium]|nr:VWA domain-containing protein [Candidatus Parcubacteria bacterium]
MKTLSKKLSFLLILFLFSFVIAQTSSAIITRDRMIHIADSYKNYIWTPTEDNICHELCCVKWNEKGKCIKEISCPVNTPDRNTYTNWTEGVGWKAEEEDEEWIENISIPYQWGGCSSIKMDEIEFQEIRGYGDFENGVENGKCAGDVRWYGNISYSAVGIDCSGFVSRCWDQGTKYGTSTIPKTFRELREYKYLRTGDALNKRGHIMLFKEFILDENGEEEDESEELPEKLKVYEASANDWKVWDRSYNIEEKLKREGYIPYSFFKQIDTNLVIDRSGSMGGDYSGSGSKMNDAKKAATMFVSMMGERDKIGVVSFNSNARIDYNLTEITEYDKYNPSEIKEAAIEKISRIYAGGGTSIGAGMQAGFDQLKTYGVDSWGNKDDVRVMILMSDGHDSTAGLTDDVLSEIVNYNNSYENNKIKVCTIGFGSEADYNLLSEIASKTDCSYQYAINLLDLYFTYRSLQMEIAGEDMLKLSNKIRIVLDEIISRTVFIDSTMGTATFAIAWEGSDLDLTLIQPNGIAVNHGTNDLDIEFIEGDTYESYKINAPMHGEWEMIIEAIDVPEEEGDEGEDFIITVSGENAMIFEANLDKQKYAQGEEIIVTVSAEDSVTETSYPQYIYGMNVNAEITTPNQTISTVQLHDDGNHNDGEADDGIYANSFNSSQITGSCTFNIKVSGNTNRTGDPFTREKLISTFVAESQLPVMEAKSIKEGVKENLEEAKTEDEEIDEKIDSIIKSVVKSLQDDLWQDETHLASKQENKVFVYEMTAIARMELYLYLDEFLSQEQLPGSVAIVFKQAIKNLVKADKTLAQVILNDAENTFVENEKQQEKFEEIIIKAEEEIEQALEHEDTNPVEAVKCYWQSWKYSQRAIQEAGK